MNRYRFEKRVAERTVGSFIFRSADAAGFAFSVKEHLHGVLTLPRRLGVCSARLILQSDEDGVRFDFPFSFVRFQGDDDHYEVILPPRSLKSGLYFFTVRTESAFGTLYAKKEPASHRIHFSEYEEPTGAGFQLLLADFANDAPRWIYGTTIYHIFVDRFFRSGKNSPRADAVFIEDFENGIPEYPEYPGAPLENNTFFGGDLDGVTEKLDRIAKLGVGCIYLSPIFEAYSNHKYDTGDYLTVDAAFGGEEALVRLIKEAKKRGIRILLDGVFNHTGDDSLYFNKRGKYPSLGAYQSRESPYYNWYDFQSYPDEYTSWWNISILPRLRLEEPSCLEFFLGNGGVIEKYAKMGIGGFRLDVADELTDSFIAGVKKKLSEILPDAILYGEVWEDASNKIAYGKRRKYYYGQELDGVMNYPLRTGILSYLLSGDTHPLRYALIDVFDNMPQRILNSQMNVLGTHDTERILTLLAGKGRDGRKNAELATARLNEEERCLAKKRLKLAYLILATLPGVPTIYYGDEAGLEGYGDPFNRMPYPWGREDAELLEHYTKIGELRQRYSVYKEAPLRLIALDKEILSFARDEGDTCYVTLINRGEMPYVFESMVPLEILTDDERVTQRILLKEAEGCVIRISSKWLSELRLKKVQ